MSTAEYWINMENLRTRELEITDASGMRKMAKTAWQLGIEKSNSVVYKSKFFTRSVIRLFVE